MTTYNMVVKIIKPVIIKECGFIITQIRILIIESRVAIVVVESMPMIKQMINGFWWALSQKNGQG